MYIFVLQTVKLHTT